MKRKMGVALVTAALPGVVGAADLPLSLRDAVRKELPPVLAQAVPAESLTYAGPEGAFRVEVGEMNGVAPAEAIVIIEGSNRPPIFLAEAGARIFRKDVKLPAGSVAATVGFHAFAEGKSLMQVSAGAHAGSVLMHWDGKGLQVVWQTAKQRPGESRWFELDDLDHDGVREIVTYLRIELDTAADDDMGETSTASSQESLGPTSVLRWTGGKWREDRAALEALR